MDLVFSSILLFIIFLPGVLFRFGYYTFPFSRGSIENKIILEVAYSVPIALILHFLSITGLKYLFGIQVDFKTLGFLLISDDKDAIAQSFSNIKNNLGKIFTYHLALCSLGGIAGFFYKQLVRVNRLDRKFDFFRFPNKWYYILTGEILDFPGMPDSQKDIELIIVDALCDTNNGSFIYTGQLFEFYLNDAGGLDSILIRYPMRKKFATDENFYDIQSKFLYLPFSEVKNFNIRYYSAFETLLDEEGNDEESNGSEPIIE